MRFINRLCIFLLGVVMGIVGCVGGLAGGVYYAYTGLSVEDFTGTLTKEDVPVLDDSAERNITQMTMEEIVTRFIGLMNGEKDLTIANLEAIYGLDLSSLQIPDNIRNMPIDKLFKDEESRNEALSYITFGAVAELLNMFKIDFLTQKYAHLFGKEGKLYSVSILSVIKDDGYIDALKDVYMTDLLPAGMLEEMEDGPVKTAITALSDISLGELLAAIIKKQGSVAEVILGAESVASLRLSDLIPESLGSIKTLLEGITLGSVLFVDEEGKVQFSADEILKQVTLRDILGLGDLFGKSVDEIVEAIPEGEVRSRVIELLDWSLYDIINLKDFAELLGDVTIGGVVDMVLGLAGSPDAIKELPEPVPTLWNSLAQIRIRELIKAIGDGTLEELMNETVLALTLNDLVGSYVNPNIEKITQPAVAIWSKVRFFSIYDYIHNIGTVKDALLSLTIGDLCGSYVFEAELVELEDEKLGWTYVYKTDETVVNYDGRIALLPDYICIIFDKLEDYTFEQYYQAYLCEIGECEHENKEDCFTLTDLLGDSLYTITFGELFDQFFRDENGETIIPEALLPLYKAIMKITVGDVVRTILGQETVDELLGELYNLTIDDLLGGWINFDELPAFVGNVYRRLAPLTVGEIVKDWHCVLEALYDITIGDLIGEYIPKDDALLQLIYGAIKNIAVRDVKDAIEKGDALILLRGFARIPIREFLSDLFETINVEQTYIIKNFVDCFGDSTIGDILLIIYCKTGNCDKAEWLGHGEQCATLLGFAEKTVFTLTVADFWEDKDLSDAIKALYDVVSPVSVQNVFNTIMAYVDPEAYGESETIITVLRRTGKDLSVGDIFGGLIREGIEGKNIAHPVPFLVLALGNVKFSQILDVVVGNADWLFVVEALEAQFALVIEDKDNLGLEADSVYLKLILEHLNPEHPVSVDFLFGYELDSFLDLFEGKFRTVLANLIQPLRDLTVREVYEDYRHIFDCYNKVTFADVFAEVLGYSEVGGVWVNPAASASAAKLFNLLANYTIYDLMYDGGADEALRNIEIGDIFFLIAEGIDEDGTWYDGLSDGMKGFIERFGKFTLGQFYDGKVYEEDLRAALGDLTFGDVCSVCPKFKYDELASLWRMLLDIRIIDVIDGNIKGILTGIKLINLIDAVCELANISYEDSYTIVRQIIRNIGSLTIADVCGLNDELTWEDLFYILIKDITVAMFLEFIPFGDSRFVKVLLASEIYKSLTSYRIEAFFRGTAAMKNELIRVVGDVSVGDVHRLVRDLAFEDYVETDAMKHVLSNQDKVSAYDFVSCLVNGKDVTEYLKTMIDGDTIYTVIFAYVAPYSKEVRDFFDKFEANLSAPLLPENDLRVPYCAMSYILGVKVGDIAFDREALVDYLKNFRLAFIVVDILCVAGVEREEDDRLFTVVIEKLITGSVWISVGDIIELIEDYSEEKLKNIIQILIGDISIGDIIFDITVIPHVDSKWALPADSEIDWIQRYEDLIDFNRMTRLVSAVLVFDLIFDIEKVEKELEPVTFKDCIEVVLYRVSDYRDYLFIVGNKILEGTDKLSVIGTFRGDYTSEYIAESLFADLCVIDFVKDALSYLKKFEAIDAATADKYYKFLTDTKIVDYFGSIKIVDIIEGSVQTALMLDKIYLSWVTTDLAANVLVLFGKDDIAKTVWAFEELIASAKLMVLINADSFESFVYELFGDSTLGDLYDILKSEGIVDLKDFEKKIDLFRDRLIAALITNFTPDELFGEIVVGDLVGEELGWLRSGGKWAATGNDEFANTKVADLVNKWFGFMPEKLRNFAVILLGGITVLIYGYINEYTLDYIIGTALSEKVKKTEFYQAIAYVSLKKLVENGESSINRIKNLTFGDLYRFVAAVINEYLIDIDCVLETSLFTKFEDNLDLIKLIWVVNDSDKLTLEAFFGGLTVGDAVRSVMDAAENEFDYEKLEETGKVYDKFIGNLDNIEIIKIAESTIDDYLGNISYGDLARILVENLQVYEVLPATLPTGVDNLIGLLTANLDKVPLPEYKGLTAETVLYGITWGHVADALVDAIGIDLDELNASVRKIVDRIRYNLNGIMLLDTDADMLSKVFYGISFGDIFDAIFETAGVDIEKYKKFQLYEKIAAVYVHDFFVENCEPALEKLYAVDVNDFVEIVLELLGYELKTEFGKKIYENLNALTVKFFLGEVTAKGVFEKVFDGLSFGDLVRSIFDLCGFDYTELESVYSKPIEKLLGNLDALLIVKYNEVTVEAVLKGISFGDVARIVLRLTELDTEIAKLHADIKAPVEQLLVNLDGIELYDYESLADPYIVLDKITYGVLTRATVAIVTEYVTDEIPASVLDIVARIAANLDPIAIPEYKGITWEIVFYGITLGEVVRAGMECFFDYNSAKIPTLTRNITNLLLRNFDEILLSDVFEATVEDFFKDITWRMVIEAVLEIVGADLNELREYTGNLVEKLLVNFGIPVWEYRLLTVENLLTGITYSDIIRSVLEYAGVCVDQFEKADHVESHEHGVEFKEGTRALVGKLLDNMDGAFVKDLFRGYFALYEIIENLVVGDFLEALYDYTGKPDEVVLKDALYGRIAAVRIYGLVADAEAELNKFDDITVADVLGLAVAFGGYLVDPEFKKLQIYEKVGSIKVFDLFGNREAVLDIVDTVDVNDVVETILYAVGYELVTEAGKLVYKNLDRLTVKYFRTEEVSLLGLMLIVFGGVTYGMTFDAVCELPIEERVTDAIKDLAIYDYAKDYVVIETYIDGYTGEFVRGILVNWITLDVAEMILNLTGNAKIANIVGIFAVLTEDAKLYELLTASDAAAFVKALLGDSTIGTLADCFSKADVYKIEEQLLSEKFDLFRPVVLADLIISFIPETLFRDLRVGDFVGKELGWLQDVDGNWKGTSDDEFANKLVADLVNEWLSFIPKEVRNVVVIALGGISTVLIAYIQDKTVDEVAGDKIPDRIKANAIYKALAFISVRKLVQDSSSIKEDLYAITYADVYDLAVALVSLVWNGVDDAIDADFFDKIRTNLGEIKVLREGSIGEVDMLTVASDTFVVPTWEQVLKGVTYADAIRVVLLWTGVDEEKLDQPVKAITDKLLVNFGRIEILDYKYLSSFEMVADGITLREIVDLIQYVVNAIAGTDYDITTMFVEEVQLIVNTILTNLEGILLIKVNEKTVYDVLDGVTYGMILRVGLAVAGVKLAELPGYTKALVDKFAANLDEIEVLDFEGITDGNKVLKNITYKEVMDCALELIEKEVSELKSDEIRNLQLYRKLGTIYLTDFFSNRSRFFEILKSSDVNDLIEIVLLIADYTFETSAMQKLYANCDALTVDYLTGDKLTASGLASKVLLGITVGDVSETVEYAVSEAAKICDAVRKLTGSARLTELVFAADYAAFVKELFGDSDIGDVYAIVESFGYDVKSNELVGYYAGLFEEVLLRDVFSDPKPENIFTDITWTDVFGPICGWTKDADGRYAYPEGIRTEIAQVLDTKVSDSLYNIFDGVHPYLITLIAVDVAAHITIIVYAISNSGGQIRNLLDRTIGEIIDATSLGSLLGDAAPLVKEIVGDANVLNLLLANSYEAFVEELFGDTTIEDVVKYFEFYYDSDYEMLADTIGLFGSRKLAEIFVNPSPAVIFGSITVGQLVGPYFGWTAKNTEKTVWEGKGLLGQHANRSVVDLLDSIEGFNTLHEYIQTLVIAATCGIGVGIYALIVRYTPQLKYILNDLTLAEIFERTELEQYMNDNRGNILGETLYFVKAHFGNKTIAGIVNLVLGGDLVTLLQGITIGDILEVVDATGIITALKEERAVRIIIDNLEGVILIDLLAAQSVREALEIVLGNITLVDILGVEYSSGNYYFNGTRIPSSFLEYTDSTGTKRYTLGQLLGYVVDGGLKENYIDNITVSDIWDLVDESRTLLPGVAGVVVYNFLDRQGNKSLSELATLLSGGKGYKILLEGITVGDLLDGFETDMEDKLGFVGKMLRQNENKLLTELIEDPDLIGTLAGSMKLGDVMDYEFREADGCWYYKATGAKLDALNSAIANILLSHVLGGSFDAKAEIGYLTLGEIMGYHYVGSTWYKDEAGTDEVDSLVAKVCGITLSEIMGGNAETVIKNALGNLKVGSVMNLIYDEGTGKWYPASGGGPVDFVIAKIADIELSTLFNGGFTIETVFTGKVGNYIGFDNSTGEWKDKNGNSSDNIMTNVCELDMTKLLKGEVETKDILGTLTIGEIIEVAEKRPDGNWYNKTTGEAYGAMYDKIFDLRLDNLMTDGIDLAVVFSGVRMGDVFGYTNDGGKWLDKNNKEIENKAILAILDHDLGEFMNDGLDYEALFNGLLIGDILGFVKNGAGEWTAKDEHGNAYVIDTTVFLKAIYDTTFAGLRGKTAFINALGHIRVGDMADGYSYDDANQIWKKADGTALDKLTSNIFSVTLADITDGNFTSKAFDTLKLGDVFGYRYDSTSGWLYADNDNRLSPIEQKIMSLDLIDIVNGNVNLIDDVFNLQLYYYMGYVEQPDGSFVKGSTTIAADSLEAVFITINLKDILTGNFNFEDKVRTITVKQLFGESSSRTGILSLIGDNTTLPDIGSACQDALNNKKLAQLITAGVITLASDPITSAVATKLGYISVDEMLQDLTLNMFIFKLMEYVATH